MSDAAFVLSIVLVLDVNDQTMLLQKGFRRIEHPLVVHLNIRLLQAVTVSQVIDAITALFTDVVNPH